MWTVSGDLSGHLNIHTFVCFVYFQTIMKYRKKYSVERKTDHFVQFDSVEKN